MLFFSRFYISLFCSVLQCISIFYYVAVVLCDATVMMMMSFFVLFLLLLLDLLIESLLFLFIHDFPLLCHFLKEHIQRIWTYRQLPSSDYFYLPADFSVRCLFSFQKYRKVVAEKILQRGIRLKVPE